MCWGDRIEKKENVGFDTNGPIAIPSLVPCSGTRSKVVFIAIELRVLNALAMMFSGYISNGLWTKIVKGCPPDLG